MASNLKVRSTTGDAVTGRAYLKSLSLTGGSDAASVAVRDGSGGSVVLTLKAGAGATVQWRSGDKEGAFFGSSVHLTFTGTGPEATAEVG